MNRRLILAAIAVLVLLLIAVNSLFTVDQASQALVLQFGNPVRIEQTPGLKFKLPFVQNVVYFDRRVLDFQPQAEEVIASDQKRLVVDCYARYQIVDPLLFYRTVGSEETMDLRLGATLSSTLRRVIGNNVLATLLSPRRAQIMTQVRDEARDQAKEFGIKVIDVRLRRADLPAENSQAIYARMISERQREANQFRAQGAQEAQGIKARADRERTVLLAEANRQADILRGEGEADSTRIYAQAFGKDPAFFAYYRTLQAYRVALGTGTTLVLTPDSEFFRYFGQHLDTTAGAPGPTAPKPAAH